MGSSLSFVSCIDREDEQHGVKPLSPRMTPRCMTCLDRDDEQCGVKPLISKEGAAEAQSQQSNATNTKGQEIKAQRKVIASALAPCQQTATPRNTDSELQEQINAILSARKQSLRSMQSPSPAADSSNELQNQINAIVGAHALSLKQQREMASPSPAKSYSDEDLGYYANVVLSQAKARSTPGRSPPVIEIPWEADETDIAPCQLNFADYDEARESWQQDAYFAGAALADSKEENVIAPAEGDIPETQISSVTDAKVEPVDDPKKETRPFNVSDIPSPTRNRAKRQQKLEEAMKKQEEDSKDEEKKEESTLDEVHRAYLEKKLQEREEAKKVAQEEVFFDCNCVEEAGASAPPGLELERAAKLQDIEEKAEMAAMDRMCVEAFLESVKRSAGRDRVRTPLKGTNLYTKHMRPARRAGTSVDVKDSNFGSLGFFLQYLEGEGLLSLQPGLTDPVVTSINFDACRKYKYAPEFQAPIVKVAPHEAGCCCRLCLKCDAAFQWQ